MSDSIKGIMDTALEKIKGMVDADTVIGQPILLPHDVTIVPVSKVSFGFASGGSDLPTRDPKETVGGGVGAGISIQPTAFIIVTGTDVRLMQVNKNPGKADNAIAYIPDIIDKISAAFSKVKRDKQLTDYNNI